MVWMWSVVETFRPTTRSRFLFAFVLHVLASSFRSTLRNGWSGVLCTHSERGVCRARVKGQSLVFTILGPRLLCVIVRACVLSLVPFTVLCSLSFEKGTARLQTGTLKAWIHRSLLSHAATFNALECSWRGVAIHCIASCSLGWPNKFLPYVPPSRVACKCRKIEEWNLSTGSTVFCAPRACVLLPSTRRDVF